MVFAILLLVVAAIQSIAVLALVRVATPAGIVIQVFIITVVVLAAIALL